jgi:pimeloyl-ACP methyl ester carboxylesterase
MVSGLGADERLLAPQSQAFANLRVAAWIEPEPRETLAHYAKRLAQANDPGGPCFVGGVSLGGMMALEMIRHLDARACLLISTIHHRRELPRRVRVVAPLAPLLAGAAVHVNARLVRLVLRLRAKRLSPVKRSILEQLAESCPHFCTWAIRALLRWSPEPFPPNVPIVHLHGDCDPILPHRYTHPDVLVPDGGHVLTLTHAEIVNGFLRSAMERLGPREPPSAPTCPRFR